MRPSLRHVVLLAPLAACDGDGVAGDGSLATGALFPAEEGRYVAFRHAAPDAYEPPGAETVLDAEDLLLARFGDGGCDGDGWRIELRTGGAWESAAPAGALHFDTRGGLAVCATEDEAGATTPLDPPAALWTAADGLHDDEPVRSGAWEVLPTREEDVPTYFGVFPTAVAFTFAGEGELDGWVLHLAEGFGPVLLETDGYTADLVYIR